MVACGSLTEKEILVLRLESIEIPIPRESRIVHSPRWGIGDPCNSGGQAAQRHGRLAACRFPTRKKLNIYDTFQRVIFVPSPLLRTPNRRSATQDRFYMYAPGRNASGGFAQRS